MVPKVDSNLADANIVHTTPRCAPTISDHNLEHVVDRRAVELDEDFRTMDSVLQEFKVGLSCLIKKKTAEGPTM